MVNFIPILSELVEHKKKERFTDIATFKKYMFTTTTTLSICSFRVSKMADSTMKESVAVFLKGIDR